MQPTYSRMLFVEVPLVPTRIPWLEDMWVQKPQLLWAGIESKRHFRFDDN